MKIYCIEDFKVEFDKLRKKKSYNTLENDIIEFFFNKTSDELCSGTRLNNSDKTPYIKKRIKGSGGFRFYYLLIMKDEKLYLMFLHPKTGSSGSENINDDSKAYLYKKVLTCIKTNDLYQLEVDDNNIRLIFNKLELIEV